MIAHEVSEVTSYDSASFSPPSPIAVVELSVVLFGQKLSVNAVMQVDTGADECCIPKSTIRQLANQLGYGTLPSDFRTVIDFNGRPSRHRYFTLDLRLQQQTTVISAGFVEVSEDIGLIGRNVLNHFNICLDGPNGIMTVI